jgi:biopolymer transport protein ExbB
MKLFRIRSLCLALALTAASVAPLAAQQPAPPLSPPPASGQSAPVPPAATPSAPRAVATTEAARPTIIPHELSPWSMFMGADIVVKAVMVGLAFASLITWTVLIAKLIELTLLRRRLVGALGRVANSRSLAEAQIALGTSRTALASFLAAAIQELRLSAGIPGEDGIKERAASRFSEITRAEGRQVRLGMGLLATIGATAPFVGLFGTVWGIMNSFIGISKAQTTNLAVVAPGIAEALLATAIGLVAAIPAVIIYNHFSRVTKGYLELVGRASGAATRLLSRDLDRARGGGLSRAAE